MNLPDSVRLILESLHSLETLNSIMQGTIERVYLQHLERFDLRVFPALFVGVVDVDHVVGVLDAEGELVEVGQGACGAAAG